MRYFLENGKNAADKKAMDEFEWERFRWIEMRDLFETRSTETMMECQTSHYKWILYEYKYPRFKFDQMVADGHRRGDQDIVAIVSIKQSQLPGAGMGLFAEKNISQRRVYIHLSRSTGNQVFK